MFSETFRGTWREQPWEKMECHPYKCSIYPGIYRDLWEYHWDILGIIVENITGIKNLPLFAHTWGNPHTK